MATLAFTFPSLGYYGLTIAYILIGAALIFFYYLTTQFALGFTFLSFIFNIILWITEQTLLEKVFHDSFFYQDETMKIFVIYLSAILWVSNKIMLDNLLKLLKPEIQENSRIEKFVRSIKEK